MFKAAELETPKLRGKVIGVESLSAKFTNELALMIREELKTTGKEVRYLNGKREEKVIMPLIADENDKADTPASIIESGIYFITGGAGGLGRIIATSISKTPGTRIILTGRSKLSKEKEAAIKKIPGAEYYPCDITDKGAIEKLISDIQKKHGRLNGIIHCAGLIKDNYLLKKTPEEVVEVLSPKIKGTKYLDEATKNESLDFMIYFSSITGVLGNAGQGDYAAANAWLDNHAYYRNQLVEKGKRNGHTLSINWPLWKDGGMQVDEETRKHLEKVMGLLNLPTEEGVNVMKILMNQEITQGIAAYGLNSKIAVQLLGKPTKTVPELRSVKTGSVLLSEVEKHIQKIASELLKIDPKDLDIDEELGDYGFDSISLTKLANTLNDYHNLELLPTIFYNYPTIAKLASYLIEEHNSAFAGHHEFMSKEEQPVELPQVPVTSPTRSKARFLSNEHKQIQEEKKNTTTSIAIIGMSGRFPGSPDLHAFWNNLEANKDLITEIPETRWNWKKYYGDPSEDKNKTMAKWGGFITDIDKFDPLFFYISPREAELMDPQQRITLEAVWHALEDAGISPRSIRGSKTGVFIGASTSDYSILLNKKTQESSQAQYTTGTVHSVLSNRISYFLDIHGPSEPIDTACSSSLVAIHRAVGDIRSGNSDMAIVGGVNALLSPEFTLSFSQAGMLSNDGRCKTFDKNANGYVRGEGVGIVILKPLSKAEADGDHIYATIRATVENHGGKANSLTSPNPNAQRDLLINAYRSAEINPQNISYIEAHGSGTSLGDPIETEGLKLAFKDLYNDFNLEEPAKPYISLGSVKTNIGHLEAAAGIAGVIKVILSLKYQKLPGNPQLKEPNEYLKLENTPFSLQRKTSVWATNDDNSRIAGISSFGFGGVNAHIILEEYQQKKQKSYQSNEPALVILSAKNEKQLKEVVSNLLNYLTIQNSKLVLPTKGSQNLYDIAYTLQAGREAMEVRLAIITNNYKQLTGQLAAYLEGKRNNIITGHTKIDKESTDLLLSGDEGRQYLLSVINNKNHQKLAQLWVKGVEIDWNLLYPAQKPCKVSLPVYPFVRERYWFSDSLEKDEDFFGVPPYDGSGSGFRYSPPSLQTDPLSPANQRRAQTCPQSLTQLNIKKKSAVFISSWSSLILEKTPAISGKILIMSDKTDKELRKTLQASLDIRFIRPQENYASFEEISGLIDLTPLEKDIKNDTSWLSLLQHIISQSNQERLKLMIVSQGAESAKNIQGADRFGIYAMLQAEYSRVESLHIDLEPGLEQEKVNELILAAYQSRTVHTRLRYDQGAWQKPVLKKINFSQSKPLKKEINGPVLITGGTRGIGMACAIHLVKEYGVKQLVLMGREPLPERDTWKLEMTADTVQGKKIRDILYLEKEGVGIKFLNTPLSEIKELKTAIEAIIHDWGKIRGFLHCAGYTDMDTPAFIKKDVAKIGALREPKVVGLNNLHEVLDGHNLAFAILFSSVSALVPRLGAGQSDYAMANSYMDSFATYQRALGYPYASVQWPSWQETGIGEVKGGLYEEMGLLSMNNKEGLNVLDQLLSKMTESPVIFPAVYDESILDIDNLLKVSEEKTKLNKKNITRTNTSTVTDWLKEQISTELKIPAASLNLETPFSDYGVDSILLAQLVKRIEKSLQGEESVSTQLTRLARPSENLT